MIRACGNGIRRAFFAGLIGLGAAGRAPAQPPPAPVPAPAPASREAELEARLRRLESRYEAMERTHAEQYDALNRRHEALLQSLRGGTVEPPAAPVDQGSQLPRRDTSREGGAGARDNPSDPSKSRRPDQRRLPTRVEFGPGFQISSEDDEFQLQFHDLTQVDIRQYARTTQDPVHSGLSIPRQRWYFTGRMTRNVEFYTTINRGFGSLDVFDAFLNFRYDERLMFKVGRFKTPFSYEFYAMSAPDFVVPERSLFASNFSPNRQLGFMGWGQLLGKRVDYAAGLFNGNRFSFQDSNESKDAIAYVNARPWGASKEGESAWPLKSLNVGGSVDAGRQDNAPLPSTLRTSIAASNAADAVNIAPPWLAFNKNVVERGDRGLWALHAAYFYKHLTLIGEWQTGFQSYAVGPSAAVTRVPVSGYYVTAGYFVTGETVDRRTQIEPLRPLNLKKGEFGLGAVELQGRFSAVEVGRSVFTHGLADPNLWSNRVHTLDLGVNWYLNTYAKIVFEWEHALFGQPVLYAPGRLEPSSDLFWARFQVYF